MRTIYRAKNRLLDCSTVVQAGEVRRFSLLMRDESLVAGNFHWGPQKGVASILEAFCRRKVSMIFGSAQARSSNPDVVRETRRAGGVNLP
jgi:hypothetical protein